MTQLWVWKEQTKVTRTETSYCSLFIPLRLTHNIKGMGVELLFSKFLNQAKIWVLLTKFDPVIISENRTKKQVAVGIRSCIIDIDVA